jgi:hypothetical protein
MSQMAPPHESGPMNRKLTQRRHLVRVGSILVVLTCLFTIGCGTTKVFTATEQLLMSDAVDSSVAKLDFRPLSGAKVYLDTTYITAMGKQPPIPGLQTHNTMVNSDYIISALRQQMTAAGCLIVDSKETADVICEARCGAIGIDGHAVTYGMPANNIFSSASSVVGGSAIPTIPEISVAKREMKSAAAKVAVFAYDRETREPVLQTGIAQAGSNARDTWVLGMGPIQQGTIYRGARFAGKRFQTPQPHSSETNFPSGLIDHRNGFVFHRDPGSLGPQNDEKTLRTAGSDATQKR